jgi:hypothetical protein
MAAKAASLDHFDVSFAQRQAGADIRRNLRNVSTIKKKRRQQNLRRRLIDWFVLGPANPCPDHLGSGSRGSRSAKVRIA